jgi:predicted dehydrogenase
MSPVRVGIVGLGIMGQLYAEALMSNPAATVAAVADPQPDRRELACQAFGCRAFDSYRDMYAVGGLDAALITLPDFMHREAVVLAAEAGLHVLVEKPFATTLADADAMLTAIERAGVKCMVEFFNRWSPPFTAARRAVEHGDLGDIVLVSAELNDAIAVPTEMLKWAARSSPAWFLMSHTADLVTWITGKRPVAVEARGVKRLLVQRGVDTYDLIEALVDFEDGTLGRFSNCWVLPNGWPMLYELKMRLVGSKAAIDIDTSDQELHFVNQEKLSHPVTGWGNILGRYVGHPYTMLAAFIDNIVDDTPPLVGPLDGWENTLFLEAVHRAVETRERVLIRR